MIAFALIFISCVPAAADLVREYFSISDWSAAPQDLRRRIVREAGVTALGLAALVELAWRFVLRS